MVSGNLGLDTLVIDGLKNLVTFGRYKESKYRQEMDRRIESAKNNAHKGYVRVVEYELEVAYELGNLAKKPMPDNLYQGILKEAYRNGTLKYLNDAELSAYKDDVEVVASKLDRVREYAPKSGLGDMKIEIERIENIAAESHNKTHGDTEGTDVTNKIYTATRPNEMVNTPDVKTPNTTGKGNYQK